MSCFLGGSDGKESACNAGDLCSIPGLRGSPGERKGYHLQYPCLENPMDRGGYSPWGHKELDLTEQLTQTITEKNKEKECVYMYTFTYMYVYVCMYN